MYRDFISYHFTWILISRVRFIIISGLFSVKNRSNMSLEFEKFWEVLEVLVPGKNADNPPLKVVNEDIILRSPLTDSKYRVIGKILGDKMMLKWMNGEAFAVRYDYFKRSGVPGAR